MAGSSFEGGNTPNAPKSPEQGNPDVLKLQRELELGLDRKEEEKEKKEFKARPVEEIVDDLVKFHGSDIKDILAQLPTGKREQVRQLINAQLPSKEYKQNLQAAYPSGTSAIAGENVSSTVSNVSEMQGDSKNSIEVADIGKNLPDSMKMEFLADKLKAGSAAQQAFDSTARLETIIDAIPREVKEKLRKHGINISRIS